MKILYASCFPDEMFSQFLKNGQIYSLAAQKFNKLFVKGFALNDIDVDVIAFITNGCTQPQGDVVESYHQRTIRYFIQKRNKGIKGKIRTNTSIKGILKAYKKEEPNGVVILDALAPSSFIISRCAKRYGLKVVSIITDFVDDTIPKKSLGNIIKNIKIAARKYSFYKQFKYTDLFVLLTEAMTERLNISKNQQYIVVNGICDYMLKDKTITPVQTDKKVLMYTGEIRKMYGIHNLIQAFLNVGDESVELHLYGPGAENYSDLQGIFAKHPNVKYFGVKPNAEIVERQKEASFLINPRLVNGVGEYVKYSFPSKTIEYMVSGRPLITTKLPCITKEYNQYVYFFDDDSIEGMTKTLRACFALSKEELEKKGKDARNFILSCLNNKENAKKILEIIYHKRP